MRPEQKSHAPDVAVGFASCRACVSHFRCCPISRHFVAAHHFIIGTMLYTYAEAGEIDRRSDGKLRSSDLDTAFESMLPFRPRGSWPWQLGPSILAFPHVLPLFSFAEIRLYPYQKYGECGDYRR